MFPGPYRSQIQILRAACDLATEKLGASCELIVRAEPQQISTIHFECCPTPFISFRNPAYWCRLESVCCLCASLIRPGMCMRKGSPDNPTLGSADDISIGD